MTKCQHLTWNVHGMLKMANKALLLLLLLYCYYYKVSNRHWYLLMFVLGLSTCVSLLRCSVPGAASWRVDWPTVSRRVYSLAVGPRLRNNSDWTSWNNRQRRPRSALIYLYIYYMYIFIFYNFIYFYNNNKLFYSR